MSARVIVPLHETAPHCSKCGWELELQAFGQKHEFHCPCCGERGPATSGELGELRRYAASWDRSANTLRRRSGR